MVKAKIVNVVATAFVNQPLDFSKLKEMKDIVYNPNVYGGRVAYFKTSIMQGQVSFFNSGKMISAGTKSEKRAFEELTYAMMFLVMNGFIKEVELHPQIQNIVMMADFEKSISLEQLAEKTDCIYEPEQFPGAILKIEKPYKASVLIFASGKTIIAGLKRSKQIKPILQRLRNIL